MKNIIRHLFLSMGFLAALAACKPLSIDTDSARFDIAVTDGTQRITTVTPKEDGTATLKLWVYSRHKFSILEFSTSKNANMNVGFELNKEKYMSSPITPDAGYDDELHVLIESEPRIIEQSAPETATITIRDEETGVVMTKAVSYNVNKYFSLAVSEIKTRNYTFSAEAGNLDNTYVTSGNPMEIKVSSSLGNLKLIKYSLTGGAGTYNYHEDTIWKEGEVYNFERETGRDQYFKSWVLDNIEISQYSGVGNVQLHMVFANPDDETQTQEITQTWTHNTPFEFEIECFNEIITIDGEALPTIYGAEKGPDDRTKLCLRVKTNRQQIYIKTAQLKVDGSVEDKNRIFDIEVSDTTKCLGSGGTATYTRLPDIYIEGNKTYGREERYGIINKFSTQKILNFAWVIYDTEDPNKATAMSTSAQDMCESASPSIRFRVRPYTEYIPEKIAVSYLRSVYEGKEYSLQTEKNISAGYFKIFEGSEAEKFPEGLPTCIDIEDKDNPESNLPELNIHEFSFNYPAGGFRIDIQNDDNSPISDNGELMLSIADPYDKDSFGDFTSNIRYESSKYGYDSENSGKASFRIKASKYGAKKIIISSVSNPTNKTEFSIFVRKPISLCVDIRTINTIHTWVCTNGAGWGTWRDNSHWDFIPVYFAAYLADIKNEKTLVGNLNKNYVEMSDFDLTEDSIKEEYKKHLRDVNINSKFYHTGAELASHGGFFLCGENFASTGYGETDIYKPSNGIETQSFSLTEQDGKLAFIEQCNPATWDNGTWHSKEEARQGWTHKSNSPLSDIRYYHVEKWREKGDYDHESGNDREGKFYDYKKYYQGFKDKHFEISKISYQCPYIKVKYVIHNYKTSVNGENYNKKMFSEPANQYPSWTYNVVRQQVNIDNTPAIVVLKEDEPGVFVP